ncbi:hypothetical protein B0O80DRAFT_506148 [Mortierella sp. GBAus27b]|nr:hypothetical protein B0O80DRAFT_506148 [Mortierella sp. GBAus27b]
MDMFTKSGDMWNGFGSLVELGGIKHGIQNHQTLTEIEQDYIWINIAWLHFLKKLDISYTAMEGWLITYIYGPLMSILMNIPNSALKMTEYKGISNALALFKNLDINLTTAGDVWIATVPEQRFVCHTEGLLRHGYIPSEIVKECSRRNEACIFGPSSSESTRNTIVDVFMVGAMQSYKADMFLAQQEHMSGRRGHGPVDFTVLDRKHQTQVLGVTERSCARSSPKYGAARYCSSTKKKRKRVEADDDDEERPSTRLRSFGIVTDAFKWRFVECTQVNDDTPTYRTKEVLRDFRIGSGAQEMRFYSSTAQWFEGESN